jgi:2-iminobutanoate/2-iminopropanoate deaminase
MDVISTSKAPAAIGPYSQAISSGGFLFCSGQIPLDPSSGEMVCGSIEEETTRVMENLQAVLAAAGISFEQVVKTTLYIVDMVDFPVVNQIYGRYFSEIKPARVTVAVAALPRGARIEIDAIAAL